MVTMEVLKQVMKAAQEDLAEKKKEKLKGKNIYIYIIIINNKEKIIIIIYITNLVNRIVTSA